MNGFVKKAALTLVLLSTLLPSACSTVSPAPTVLAAEAFAPMPAEAKEKAVIRIPCYSDSESLYEKMLGRMNGWLENAGQNVEIQVKKGPGLTEGIKAEIAAGASATAYAVRGAEGQLLLDEKVTADIAELIRINAPNYYSKYSNLLPKSLGGVPVAIYERPLWLKPALMLRQDVEREGGGVTTIDGFFRFIDSAVASAPEKRTVMAEPYYLINEWALEQGYYNIDVFNIRGYLYAATDDPACAPVTLESIPGFSSFVRQLCAYYKGGTLNNSPAALGAGVQVVGYLASLHVYYNTHPYSAENWRPWISGEFTAHGFSPDLPSHMVGPYYEYELAMPATASPGKAADVIRFVEWLYAGQDNYDAVLYGEKGADYVLENARFTPLVGGRDVGMSPMDKPSKFYFTWPGCNVLCNSDFSRVPTVAPVKVEEVVESGIKRNLRFPLYAYLNTFEADSDGKLGTADDIKGIGSQRMRLIDNFLFSTPNALALRTEEDIAALLDALSACKNAQLTDAYAGLIRGLIAKNNPR